MIGFEHPLARAALEEVIELHAFFEAWLGGTGPDTASAFAQVESALAETFTMVSPEGRRQSRGEVIAWLRRAYGSKGSGGAFRISIRETEVHVLSPPLAVVGYVEEQTSPTALTLRSSTAVLGMSPTGERPRWLALHETWIA